MNLRPYQTRAIELLRARWRENPILCLPTGAGKTVVASEILRGASEKGRRSLIVAHTRQIVFQTARRFREHGLNVGVVMAGTNENRPVTVASIQTLARRSLAPFDVVIVDECHHATSESYRRVLQGCFIGLTATPCRLDGKGLGRAGFGRIIEPVTYESLFADGWLAKPLVYAPTVPDLKGIKIQAGDFTGAEKRITGNLVEHYRKLADGAKAVAFACSIEHSQRIATAFRDAGVPAEHLDGSDPQETRDAVLARLQAGATRVVANCSLFGEGWDMPELEVCIMARPTLSDTVYRQQAGRVMRPLPGKTPVILDHAGNSLRLGMPWDQITWTLEGVEKAAGVAPVRRCPECFAVCPAACSVCPECGFTFPIAARSLVPRETSEQLAKQDDASAKRSWYAERVKTASALGYKLGWAKLQYKSRYGVWPRGMGNVEAAYVCRGHELQRSAWRSYCARCLRTLDSAGNPARAR